MDKIKPLVHPVLTTIIERFPEHNDTFLNLFRTNPSFNEICRDHGQCCRTLDYWKAQGSEEASNRIDEYKEILYGLEQEVLQYIKQTQSFSK